MGLGEWFRGKKEGLERGLVMKALASVDAWGLSRWPLGWIKARRAAAGWKTIVGALVFYTPDILSWTASNLPSLMGAVGMEAEQAAPIIKAIGATLTVVGVIHKWLKFTEPLERREGERVITGTEGARSLSWMPTVSVQLGPEGMTPKPATTPSAVVAPKLTKLENDVFRLEYAKRINDGMRVDQARAEAIDVVIKDREKGAAG